MNTGNFLNWARCLSFFFNFQTTTDCDNVIKPMTLYAVMCYSGASGTLNVLLSFVVGPMGKKRTTLLVFIISAIAGLFLLFVNISLLSIALFYVFLYVALILGNVNTYLVELNPTYLRFVLCKHSEKIYKIYLYFTNYFITYPVNAFHLGWPARIL